MATNVPFAKMNGAGNQILVADMRRCDAYIQPAALDTYPNGSVQNHALH